VVDFPIQLVIFNCLVAPVWRGCFVWVESAHLAAHPATLQRGYWAKCCVLTLSPFAMWCALLYRIGLPCVTQVLCEYGGSCKPVCVPRTRYVRP
jgi:hypothetical protein